jgi:hypothetical protein
VIRIGAEDGRTRHHDVMTDATHATDLNDRTGAPPGPNAHEPVDDPESASTRPGRAVPWPPASGQRGLASPYPPGGTDPEPDAGRREERFYLRLLVGMVLLIVLGGLAISVIGLILGFAPGSS